MGPEHAGKPGGQAGVCCANRDGTKNTTQQTEKTFSHWRHFILLSSDLAHLPAHLTHPAYASTYLYFQHSTATTVYSWFQKAT